MPAIARIIDANANRAREALRVMEEAARFLLEDAALTESLKRLRHDLAGVLADVLALEVNRDTPGDVGTAISTETESIRDTPFAVVVAAGKRLGEALRAIEEYGKTIDPGLGASVESLRYRAYELERLLHAGLGSGRRRQWRLCLLLTRSLCRRPWNEVLTAALRHGADCVQVREKELNDSALLDHVQRVIECARPSSAAVIINDRIDIALAAEADGVHLGADDLPIREARRIAGRSLLIGASSHDLDEAQAAIEQGADYCGVGAMFPTALKPDRAPAGPTLLRSYLDRFSRTPHLAIGGVTPMNIGALVEVGCQGVAASSAICGADDPGRVTRQMVEALSAGQASSSSNVPAASSSESV